MAVNAATQQFVPIDRVRDGIILLKTGELRSVIITSSLNLALKSEDEQQAIIMQFQNFLNSLDFPVEFFIQSRNLNIKPYIELLQKRSAQVEEDLLKIQIREYMSFIQNFAEETNIMTKHFFIVVPYIAPSTGSIQNSNPFLSFGQTEKKEAEGDAAFNSARMQLEQRIMTVIQGLSRFGVRGQKLGTEEVIELFYKLFNPGDIEGQAPKLA
jgi:hypothetical protein